MGNTLGAWSAQGHPMLGGSSSCQLVPTLRSRLVTSAPSASLPSCPAARLHTHTPQLTQLHSCTGRAALGQPWVTCNPCIEYAGTSAPARPWSLSPANDIMRKRDLGRKGCADLEASHLGILGCPGRPGRLAHAWTVKPSSARHCLAIQPRLPVSCHGTPEEASCLIVDCLAFDALLICAASDDIRPDIPPRTGYRELWPTCGQQAPM
ncbi:hypothetical protein KVR01_010301 [Diaporthe batatas]|uniref:uncharacterized protein n=1 Tax=Diaporthe batatas TaxID=748121 RepID=UPI001D04E4FA|nr:uncharacterized protein KVR01_010301 [Diaporthe batatas]KAG8159664.1 hypothetical protein KVR01_010301 [Diaporthe batatas]